MIIVYNLNNIMQKLRCVQSFCFFIVKVLIIELVTMSFSSRRDKRYTITCDLKTHNALKVLFIRYNHFVPYRD